ncbi:MAG: type II toxin-antitoxin system YoeB family toxin [Treponema sp.]|nr:type II toxin-antitoxin system YoeB family toxin [Treponema sp.]
MTRTHFTGTGKPEPLIR